MGAFNIVRACAVCPTCRQETAVAVQFKYGDTWQHEYDVGDQLRWGGNDIGVKGKKHVVVDGIAEVPCAHCGSEGEWNLYVHVEHDRLTRVETANGAHDFAKERKTYVILED